MIGKIVATLYVIVWPLVGTLWGILTGQWIGATIWLASVVGCLVVGIVTLLATIIWEG